MRMSSRGPDNGETVTKQLCHWIHDLSINDIPNDIQVRAKYLILDGLCCAIIGAHLPWTERATHAVFDMESPGNCTVWGWNKVWIGESS
jgi:aconitate decarboxylase